MYVLRTHANCCARVSAARAAGIQVTQLVVAQAQLPGWRGCVQEPPKNKLIVQPPADHVLGEASCAHYTWGAIFNDKDGHAVWSFDKRTYTGKELETKVGG